MAKNQPHYIPPWLGWCRNGLDQFVNLYDKLTNIGFDSNTRNFDASNRLRVSTPFTVFDIKQNTSNQPLFYDDQEVSGSGTSSTYNDYKASTTIGVSANTAGKRVRQTKVWGQYQPGKSQFLVFTVNFRGYSSGNYKRCGMFNENWGIFWEVSDDGIHCVVRTFNTGEAVDTSINQRDWNVDKLDGTGLSGITLDLNQIQILVIDYEWLGAGQVRFGLKIEGEIIHVHRFQFANISDEVYMSNPNAPIRFEIENDGTGPEDIFDTHCVSVESEGGQEENSLTTYVSRDGVPITLANQDLFTPVISISLKNTRPCTRIKIRDISVLATSNTNYEWAIFLNPTIGGVDAVSWVNVTNSAIRYDISRTNVNTLTGGYKIAGGYGASSNQARLEVGDIVAGFLTIGTLIDGTPEEFVLGVKNIDADGGTVYGGLTIGEYC